MSKTYDEWLKYYEGCNKEQVIFDIMLDGKEIERLNNIINEIRRLLKEEYYQDIAVGKILRMIDKDSDK